MSKDSRLPLVVVVGISAIAIAFLFWLIYFKPQVGDPAAWSEYLPPLNAALNASSAIALCFGVVAIKKRQVDLHQRLMLLAFAFSAAFLLSYIAYYAYHGNTHFLPQGWIRPVYFFTLISHILLSIVALPLVLYTFTLAFLQKWKVHRAWARWTFPIWLYVSVTGVVVFVFQRLFNQPS